MNSNNVLLSQDAYIGIQSFEHYSNSSKHGVVYVDKTEVCLIILRLWKVAYFLQPPLGATGKVCMLSTMEAACSIGQRGTFQSTSPLSGLGTEWNAVHAVPTLQT